MKLLPLRLPPGADLRAELEALASQRGESAFVVCGIGSLGDGRLRLAGEHGTTVVAGPLEILTLAGSLTSDGAHLHMSVSDPQGRVYGGHVVDGNRIRTTAELLLAFVPGWAMTRVLDATTGYPELDVRRTDNA